MLPPINYRLNDFKMIAGWIDKLKLPPIIRWFIKSWLFGLETYYIDHKVRKTVDDAIAPVEPPEPVIEAPTYHSEPSEVEGLPILGYTYGFTRTRNQDEGGLQSLSDTGVERTRTPKANSSPVGNS